MQTFLPYKSFTRSASCLDRQRLGKQRVEAYQLLRALRGDTRDSRWLSHPAAKMWKGYEVALAQYGIACCIEWISRGYKDTLLRFFVDCFTGQQLTLPWWVGLKCFHESHQSNLVRKRPDVYRVYFGDIRDDLPYLWPVR